MHWRRKWQPTPVFLPGESQGQRSLASYNPWGRKESYTTERLTFSLSLNSYRNEKSVSDHGNINICVTEDPLSAQKFAIVENKDSRKSIFKLIKDVLKPKSVSVKTLEVTVK